MTALSAHGLSKRYNERIALDDASIAIEPGEFVAVLGPSGAGKTTLFRCLTRLAEPDAGQIEIGGKRFDGLRGRALANARRQIGVVCQQFNLVRRLSALDNVLAGRLATTPFWRVAIRRFARQDVVRTADALAAVGLADHLHQRAATLLEGQQRVAVARALAQESRILLADESIASLGPETAVTILTLMREISRTRGIAILCTLHQPQLAARFSDRVVVMKSGHLTSRWPSLN